MIHQHHQRLNRVFLRGICISLSSSKRLALFQHDNTPREAEVKVNKCCHLFKQHKLTLECRQSGKRSEACNSGFLCFSKNWKCDSDSVKSRLIYWLMLASQAKALALPVSTIISCYHKSYITNRFGINRGNPNLRVSSLGC